MREYVGGIKGSRKRYDQDTLYTRMYEYIKKIFFKLRTKNTLLTKKVPRACEMA